MARAQAASAAPTQLHQLVLPPGATFELPFDVRVEGGTLQENRVVFGALRSTAPIAAITLLDPARRRIWRRIPAELGLTPRDQASKPELGDAIVLPEIRNAAGGRWTLLLERAAPTGAPGRLLLGWQVLPRFELWLTAQTPKAAAGQMLLVTARATDYGVPIAGLKTIDLVLLDASGQPLGQAPAREDARSKEGIPLSQEPGSYIATVTLPQPGTYRLQASHDFVSATQPAARSTVIELSAGPRGAALQLLSVRPDGTPGRCARNLVFRFDAQVAESGTYVCKVVLRTGDAKSPSASGSADLPGGHGALEVIVSAAKWIAAGNPGTLARTTLLRVDGAEVKVLADIDNLSLVGQHIDIAALCR